MDPLQNKRPATQTQRQITKTTFGNLPTVPREYSSRPVVGARKVFIPVVSRQPVITAPNRLASRAAIPVQQPVKPPVSPINMELPGEESPARLNVIKSIAGRRKYRRVAFRSLAVALVLLITMGGLLFSQSYLKIHKVFKGGSGTAEALKVTVDPNMLKGEGRGRVNILLLGRGGGMHDAPDLTDTMMLASIDPVNHTSTLFSIPRDLWVNIPGRGVDKINAAWEDGEFKYLGRQTTGSTNPQAITAGFDSVDKTVGDVLGLTIDYNVLINFQAFRQAVDTVGGVNINVPADLVDPTMAWENGNNPLLAKAGLQTFDGKHGLIYARSRETTSDFARAARQRALLVALKGKVATLGTLSNPLKLSGLLSAFGNNVQTDLSINNATRLYSIMSGVDDSKVSSLGLSEGTTQLVTGGNINGQSVVLPKAGLFKYGDIQQFVRAQLKDPYIIQENAKILVLNGTPMPGIATAKSAALKTYGYNVTGLGNTPTSGWSKTTVVDITHANKYTKNYLEQRFGQKAADSLRDKTIPTNGADFVIILGSDEANFTQP